LSFGLKSQSQFTTVLVLIQNFIVLVLVSRMQTLNLDHGLGMAS